MAIMRIMRSYEEEFKKNAVTLAQDIGLTKAVNELGIPSTTLNNWIRKYKKGEMDLGPGTQKPKTALTLAEEVKELRQTVKQQEMELREKERTIDILKEASIFFAQSRKK